MTTYRITTKKKAIKGSEKDDSFFGSKFKDIFDGRDGDDYVSGAEGSDNLTGGGGDGSDKVLGGLGKDNLYGGLGKDILQGQDGNDTLYGEADRDNLYGDVGNDKLYGGESDDSLMGGEGDDRLYGGEDDWLYADKGNDRLGGGKGDDDLHGGEGNDYLSGGAGDDNVDGRDPSVFMDNGTWTILGKDRLLGGDGKDKVWVDDGDNALGGKGIDTLSLSLYSRNSSLSVKYSLNFSSITGKKAVDIGYGNVKAGQFEKVSASVSDMDVGSFVTGSKGSDTINAEGKSGMINGGAGNDTLSANGYNSDNPANGIIVDGGAGDDKLSGDGHVTLVGGAGEDQFSLSRGSDCTIADFSGKDYFLIRATSFRYYDFDLDKYVIPTFDRANPFVAGTDPKPATALAQFLYDTDDGKIYFDADGTGLNFDPYLVATLANKAALKASDFVI
ncbi:calcium-binding protein [Microvirga sp. RSM25]|uniref:calcium-binding protein n=1 Tax=Microvirga sp. RSM25 TaxID=3273802 RepID=UPI00384EBFA7